MKIFKARAKFFSSFPVETRSVAVDNDGTVRVWDNVAGRYTTCHALTPSVIRRIRRMAKKLEVTAPAGSGTLKR
ncbi:MAG TPA: hypothetical protein VNK91_01865 [Burkholderiaceae bacterium]|nr:hypothetical protein [Burkholderiaceae bacterium]